MVPRLAARAAAACRRHPAAAHTALPGRGHPPHGRARASDVGIRRNRNGGGDDGRGRTPHGRGYRPMALRRGGGRNARSQHRPAVAHPAARPRRLRHPHGTHHARPHAAAECLVLLLRPGICLGTASRPRAGGRAASRGEPHPPAPLAGAARHGASQGRAVVEPLRLARRAAAGRGRGVRGRQRRPRIGICNQPLRRYAFHAAFRL